MSEPEQHRTEAETRHTWWPGWIWAIPLAALGVALWLGIRALAQGGETVVVSFDDAYGMKAGETIVTYRGVKVGEVSQLVLTGDGRQVEAKLKLDRDEKKYLRTGTRFWLVGAKFDASDLTSIKALLGGPTIAMEPGPGRPARHFAGQDQPPALPTPTRGTPFVLTADKTESLDQGSPIYYAGKQVGRVTAMRLMSPHRFEFDAFVSAPYDRLVNSATRFWDANAVQISAKGAGVKAKLLSPKALLAGAVVFDTPAQPDAVPPSTAGTRFTLYENQDQADDAPIGPQISYLVRFGGAVGGLSQGAAVELRGFRVGEVQSVKLGYDARTGTLSTPVQIELEPSRLAIAGVRPPANGDWRPIVDAMLRRLIAQGLRARLAQDPPIIGEHKVKLVFVAGAPRATLTVQNGLNVIPSTAGANIDAIMAKVNAIPIEQIGDNVRRITARIQTLVSSPQITSSLNHINSTLIQMDRTMREVSPQIGPLVAELRQTANQADSTVAAAKRIMGGAAASQDADLPGALRQLTEMARSIRALADELDRHPEALIEGKAKDGK